MKKVLLTICLIGMFVVVQGCSPNYYYNPNRTQAEAEQDCAVCKYEAAKASYTPMGAFDSPFMSAMQEGTQHNRVYKLCMEAKGYKLITKSKLQAIRTQQGFLDDLND